MLTRTEEQQIEARGIEIAQVIQQIENFKKGFPFLNIDRPASIGDGIIKMSEQELDNYVRQFSNKSAQKNLLKFVPASGAATRMFKDLFAFAESGEPNAASDQFIAGLKDFAFYEALNEKVHDDASTQEIAQTLLDSDGLGYGSLPKGLLSFHKYENGSRTPLEEHLIEGAEYARGESNIVHLHFTVSPEHQSKFDELVSKVKSDYESQLGVTFNITFSQQKPSTDTIAVDMENKPFDDGGQLLFRPAGHGALLANLNDLDADVIFVKNIDNVLPDRLKADTFKYKKGLAGLLLELQQAVFDHLSKLASGEGTDEAVAFCKQKLGVDVPGSKVFSFLNRPIRVCGMVKNTGEPGGGPFWVKGNDGTESLQVAETAQIDMDNLAQSAILKSSSHFNPVDLVCATKDYRGNKFDLLKFRDESTGFISYKSKNGKDLKAQELPGLWNGAMADWITLFVEVPISTFSPVKTVNDLLKDTHQ